MLLNKVNVFEFESKNIEYSVQRTSRKRSVGIQVRPNASVLLLIPKRFSEKNLDEILEKRAAWILEKQKRFKENYKSYSLLPGSLIPYRGESLTLNIRREAISQRSVIWEETQLNVLLKNEDDEKQLRTQLLLWYQTQAREKIIESIYRFQMQLGVSAKRISIRNQKQRWGSCNSKHHLNFNWRLILAPPQVLDYVVVHELSHIAHLNHSSKFWKKVESVLPSHKEQRRLLRQKAGEYFSFLNGSA